MFVAYTLTQGDKGIDDDDEFTKWPNKDAEEIKLN